MLGKLSADIFQQRRLILNGVSMDMKLTPSRPAFSLTSEDEESFKVKNDATLFVRKCELSPSVALGHAAGLEVEPFKIPIDTY
jgi:hypothetical protein